MSESATATVYHGEYRGQEVAVKIFNPEMINREKLVKEFQMIRYLLATCLSPYATQHADAPFSSPRSSAPFGRLTLSSSMACAWSPTSRSSWKSAAMALLTRYSSRCSHRAFFSRRKIAYPPLCCARVQVLANHTDRQFDWNRFFSLAEGLIGGLNTFHNNKPQILHREIRPQNLLVSYNPFIFPILSSRTRMVWIHQLITSLYRSTAIGN